MPALSNPKYEMFARCLVQGMSQAKAYVKAGYSQNTANASTLAKRPEVRARVQELIEERERATGQMTIPDPVGSDLPGPDKPGSPDELDPDWVLMELVENARAARQAGQFSASTKALEMIGRALGMFNDEEVSKRKRKEAEDNEAALKKGKAVPIDRLNALLSEQGFQGVIDLTNLTKQPEAALPVDAVSKVRTPDDSEPGRA